MHEWASIFIKTKGATPKKVLEFMDFLFENFFGLFPSTYSILKDEESLDLCKKTWLFAFKSSWLLDESNNYNLELLMRAVSLLSDLNQQFMPSCGQFIYLYFNGLEDENANNQGMPKNVV